jgi:GAF domain-containing protein
MFEFPPDEAERVSALVSYGILDSDFEESFDRITRVAANSFGVPIALVSLVDGARQWFKSAVGIEARQTERSISFCTHTILGKNVMVVPDATQDRRFRENPLVVGAPNIRFYAGAPLVTPDGFNIGTMCIIDRAPRAQFDERQQIVLRDLAGIVIDLMEARRLRRQAAITGLEPR